MLGWPQAIPVTQLSEAPSIRSELPTLPPDIVQWAPERGYYQPEGRLTERERQVLQKLGIDSEAVEGWRRDATVVEAQLAAVKAELAGQDATPPFFRSGVAQFVLRLSPPSSRLRAIIRLREGRLFEITHLSDSKWNARPLSELRPSMIETIDLTGDGRPEIIAGRLDGSGAILSLQVFAWNDKETWTIFQDSGAMEPGQFGFREADFSGRRDLLIDTGAGHGIFNPGIHGPYLRDRLVYRYDGRSYVLRARYRFATPFYHLNRYLYLACKGDWQRAATHAEPGAKVDRRLAAWLGEGGLIGGGDTAFVNGWIGFRKGKQEFHAEFGPTGRLSGISSREPSSGWPTPQRCGE